MSSSRRPTESLQLSDEISDRINSPADLLRELEKLRGRMNHTERKRLPCPINLDDIGKCRERLEKEFTHESSEIIKPLGAFQDLPGVSFEDSSVYSTHPILVHAIELVRSLLKREGTRHPIPELGVVTDPTFNAAAIRFKKRSLEKQTGLLAFDAISIHYSVFWALVDVCFAMCWLTATWSNDGPEYARRFVIPMITSYVRELRQGLRDGTGTVPEFPPDHIREGPVEVTCAASAWTAAELATMFILLHEVGHVLLHFEDYNIPQESNTCSLFCMAGDPHQREFEADAFAVARLKLLRPQEIVAGEPLSHDQLQRALLLGLTGLFTAIDLFDARGRIASLFSSPSHPSPAARCYRALRGLGFPKEMERATQKLLTSFRIWKYAVG